jgi:hypothetical protein
MASFSAINMGITPKSGSSPWQYTGPRVEQKAPAATPKKSAPAASSGGGSSPFGKRETFTYTTTPHWSLTGNTQTTPAQVQSNKLATETKAASDRSNAENKKRETEIRAIYDQVIGMYSAGGSYGKGMEAQLDRERTQTLASGGQSLISSGMYNTTGLAGLSTQFAENVAAPTRAKLEDLRMDKLSSALGQKAGFVEAISNEQPDYKALSQLLSSM